MVSLMHSVCCKQECL